MNFDNGVTAEGFMGNGGNDGPAINTSDKSTLPQSYTYEYYPSSSNIPFPFPTGPYKQQAALMDTMLQTLELIDNEGDDDTTCRGQANVMMLESPTGTGKSLSLACAALAWLKHREQLDLTQMAAENVSDKPDLEASKDKPEPIHWLDAWAPPEQIEQEKAMQEKKKECEKRASSTRQALELELDGIRRRIQNEVRINRNARSGYKLSNETEEDEKKVKDRGSLRSARENVVKIDVDRRRNESRQNQSRGRALKSETVARKKRARSFTDVSKDPDDFCLDAHQSDNEEAQFGNSSHARCYDYDSSDDDDDCEDDCEMSKHTGTSTLVSKKKVETRDLLEGGQLDGSGFRPHQSYSSRNKASSSYNNHDKQNDQATVSIGNVQPGSGVRKIVYAARTHSQLSQFVGEIRRTAWGENIRVVTLGGRKLLCGNTDVTGHDRRRSEAFITEKCLDMQKGITGGIEKSRNGKSEKKTTVSCPLLSKQDLLPTLVLHMLAKPSDIEDLAGLGKKTNTCSYYASRESLKAAEVVVVPYNTLLSKSARDAVGLSLKKSLVIVDEAHNIPEALRSLSSSKLTLTIIDRASAQLKAYVGKYLSRLAGRNIFHLGQIQKFLTQAARHLKLGQRESGSKRSMMSATELLFTLKLDNLNLFNIIAYLEKSRLSQKLHGFNSAAQRAKTQGGTLNTDDPEFISKHISSMSIVETFLKCLTSTQKEGRVIIETPNIDSSVYDDSRTSMNTVPCFRYLLLDPSNEFKHVLDEAHAVVLAGGTLRPFSHVATELFGSNQRLVEQAKRADGMSVSTGVSSNSNATMSASLSTFTCDHVVPPSNVLMTCMPKGPNRVCLDFRHSSRFQHEVCDELGESILSISRITPNGMVVFLPSYSYEAFVVKRWKATGAYEKIKEEKKMFREPQSARDVEVTLASYSNQASSKNGAILLCVVGGKMSEGINFANEMARCVFIVGLPYPDITDPELREKMDLLDKEQQAISGQEYYQNLCMRAVNQSIGRAIRHAKDYAAIVLADARYSSNQRVWKGLPEWLRSNTNQSSKTFHQNLIDIKMFYHNVAKSSSFSQ